MAAPRMADPRTAPRTVALTAARATTARRTAAPATTAATATAAAATAAARMAPRARTRSDPARTSDTAVSYRVQFRLISLSQAGSFAVSLLPCSRHRMCKSIADSLNVQMLPCGCDQVSVAQTYVSSCVAELPRVDIMKETSGGFVLVANVPGFSKKDVEVKVCFRFEKAYQHVSTYTKRPADEHHGRLQGRPPVMT